MNNAEKQWIKDLKLTAKQVWLYMIKYVGEPCKSYSKGCAICDSYKAYIYFFNMLDEEIWGKKEVYFWKKLGFKEGE